MIMVIWLCHMIMLMFKERKKISHNGEIFNSFLFQTKWFSKSILIILLAVNETAPFVSRSQTIGHFRTIFFHLSLYWQNIFTYSYFNQMKFNDAHACSKGNIIFRMPSGGSRKHFPWISSNLPSCKSFHIYIYLNTCSQFTHNMAASIFVVKRQNCLRVLEWQLIFLICIFLPKQWAYPWSYVY